MNEKQKLQRRKEIWHKYHVPGCSNLHSLKINAIFISTANSLKHELKKTEVCYKIKKKGNNFITEAERKKRRVDVVDIDTGTEYEIETDKRRAKRFEKEKGVVVIKA